MHPEPGGCSLFPRRIAYILLAGLTAALLLYLVLLALWTRGLLESLLEGRSRDLATRVVLKSSVSDEQAQQFADRVRTQSPHLELTLIGRDEARTLLALQEPWMKNLPDVEIAELPAIVEIRHPDALTTSAALLNLHEWLRSQAETDFLVFNDYQYDRLYSFAAAARGYGSAIVFALSLACGVVYILFNLAAGALKGVHRIATGLVLALGVSVLACVTAFLLLIATQMFVAREFGASDPSRTETVLLAMGAAFVLILLLELRSARTPRIRVRRRAGTALLSITLGASAIALVFAAAAKPTAKPNFYSEKTTASTLRATPATRNAAAIATRKPTQTRATPTPKAPSKATPPTTLVATRALKTTPDLPLHADPYRLAAFLEQRVNLTAFLPSAAEQKQFRSAALRQKYESLLGALQRVEQVTERHEKNVRSAGRAVYLLHLANEVPAYLGANPSLPHLIAVRATLEQDARARSEVLETYTRTRDALNAAAEELAAVESSADMIGQPWWSVTRTLPEFASDATKRLLDSVSLTATEAETLDASHHYGRVLSIRQALAEFAPEPPADVPLSEIAASDPGGRSRTPSAPRLEPPRPVPGMYVIARAGQAVLAPAAGRVVFAGPTRAGNVVMIEHEGMLTSVVADLENLRVTPNDRVSHGAKLGEASSSGSIYYELRQGSKAVAPGALLGDTPVSVSLGLK
jgi:murein DD-endopeptidase MepM/ murein hydrolase activator NlpD